MTHFTRRSFLQTTVAATTVAAMPLSTLLAQEKKKKILFFSRSQGFQHGPVKLEADGTSVADKTLQELAEKMGFDLVCTKDGAIFDKDLSSFDAFLFYTSGNLDQPKNNDPDNDKPMSKEGVANFFKAIRGGTGFLGIHSATDTWRSGGTPLENQPEEKQTEYIRMIGGEFIKHGAQQEATVIIPQPAPARLEWLKSQPETFRHFEEWYAHKNFATDIRVLMIQDTAGMKTDGNNEVYLRPPFPCVWARKEGEGTVAYTAFGHNNELWKTPFLHGHLEDMIKLVLGETRVRLNPNMDRVTPGAMTLKNP